MIYKKLYSESEIKQVVGMLADKLVQKLGSELDNAVILPVLNGAMIFASDFIRELNKYGHHPEVLPIKVSSYEGMQSTGQVRFEYPSIEQLREKLKGKTIVILEDIVDTGLTARQLIETLLEQVNPEQIYLVALLKKKDSQIVELPKNEKVHYLYGIHIPKVFVIGYGLDLDGKYRNLPYIAQVIVN